MMGQRLAKRLARRTVRRIPVRGQNDRTIHRHRHVAPVRGPEHRPGLLPRRLPDRQRALGAFRNHQRRSLLPRARREPGVRPANRAKGRLAHLQRRGRALCRDQYPLPARDLPALILRPHQQCGVFGRAHPHTGHRRHSAKHLLRNICDPARRKIGLRRAACHIPGLRLHIAHQGRPALHRARRLKRGFLFPRRAPRLQPVQRRPLRAEVFRAQPAPAHRFRQNRREILRRLLIATKLPRDQIKKITPRARRVIRPQPPFGPPHLHRDRTLRLRPPFRSPRLHRLSEDRPEQILRALVQRLSDGGRRRARGPRPVLALARRTATTWSRSCGDRISGPASSSTSSLRIAARGADGHSDPVAARSRAIHPVGFITPSFSNIRPVKQDRSPARLDQVRGSRGGRGRVIGRHKRRDARPDRGLFAHPLPRPVMRQRLQRALRPLRKVARRLAIPGVPHPPDRINHRPAKAAHQTPEDARIQHRL